MHFRTVHFSTLYLRTVHLGTSIFDLLSAPTPKHVNDHNQPHGSPQCRIMENHSAKTTAYYRHTVPCSYLNLCCALLCRCRHYIQANATTSLGPILSTYPGPLELVTIQCPTPQFEARGLGRLVLKQPLVEAIVENLVPGGRVRMQPSYPILNCSEISKLIILFL